METTVSRRDFLYAVGLLAAGTAVALPEPAFGMGRKLRVALVGTGVRGISFWGRRLVEHYADHLQFVGLCDTNPGRMEYAREYMKVDCPLFTDFDRMVAQAKPDLIIVSTPDSTHHGFIIKGLAAGCDVITEKPLTTDEFKAQAILDAERRYGKNLIVGFNYRWSPYMTKIKELLQGGAIGKVTSVDFHWYLNIHHGSSYFRRWNGLMEYGGSLWVHKATHHFDLLNWWLDSEPEEVFAYGALEHYGSNGLFRGASCRSCTHKDKCAYHWDVTKDRHSMGLYVENEAFDGYIRDSCVYRKEIDIYDKMSAQIRYADGVVSNYSLTTYSPFEGWRIAFNGHKGRLEAWLDIPWMKNEDLDQESLHAAEMSQGGAVDVIQEPVIVHKNWEDHQVIQVTSERSGHGGGDRRLQDRLFRLTDTPDPYGHSAGVRDGVMSMLIGVAARKSIVQGGPVKIASLTDLVPMAKRSAVQ